jgi:hypothetical protein
MTEELRGDDSRKPILGGGVDSSLILIARNDLADLWSNGSLSRPDGIPKKGDDRI